MSRCKTPCLAITLGEPAGIGPEVALKSIVRLLPVFHRRRVIEPSVRFVLLGVIPPHLQKTRFFNDFQLFLRNGSVKFIDVAASSGLSSRSVFPIGKSSFISGRISFLAIQKAVEMALKKEVDGIVTAPVSKVSLALAGVSSHLSPSDGIGHTELLLKITRSKRVQMVMCARKNLSDDKKKNCPEDIRVILVTRHLPLSEVSQNLSVSKIVSAAVDYASVFGKKTKFAVCALNPHASDNGLLGNEEKKIISPAVRKLKKMGYVVGGPFPSDSVFADVISDKNSFDCVLAMYHDQAMIPLKVINRRSIVNLTIGLPFIRTSPGHGVAFDIADKPGLADEQPMIESIKFALNNYHLWQKR